MADYKKSFAARLKNLRSERGLTQVKLAEIIDSTPRTMKNWEGGINIPPVESLCKIADYFDVSLDYLVGRETTYFMFDSKIFSDRLRKLLQDNGVAQLALAQEIGVSPATMSEYLSGKKRPLIDRFIQIADYFNVSIDYLVGRD